MFETIRKVFAGAQELAPWAAASGLQARGRLDDPRFVVEGTAGGHPWLMERGAPSRDYVLGSELRARADLGLDPDIGVMVMNRALKEALERQAYAGFTDSLRTTADAAMHEEMRWVAMFEELRWSAAPGAFWRSHAVLGERRDVAQAWLVPSFIDTLCARAHGPRSAQLPLVLLLMQGRVYLRTEFTPATLHTLEQAVALYRAACQAALAIPRAA